jgi:hypothetical protein
LARFVSPLDPAVAVAAKEVEDGDSEAADALEDVEEQRLAA